MLNDSIDNIRLDLNRDRVKAAVCVRQGDTKTRTIHCTIADAGLVVSLENAILGEILIKKADGYEADNTVVIVGDELQYTLRTTDISAIGDNRAQFIVTFDDGSILTSPEFSIYVSKKVINQSVQASFNEYDSLKQQVVIASGYAEQCKDNALVCNSALEDMEGYLETLEETKTIIADAEANVLDAEVKTSNYRDDAEEFRDDAEQFRNDAESYCILAKGCKDDADASSKSAYNSMIDAKGYSESAKDSKDATEDFYKATKDLHDDVKKGLDSKADVTTIGDLNNLITTAKDNLVDAINEAAQSGGGGGGGGSVTSVGISVPPEMTVSGSPITSKGTIAIGIGNAYDIPTKMRESNWDAAYTHSQSTHAPSDAQKNVNADWNATSGDAEILNKPNIPTEATVSGWGFTKNTGDYSKPSGGIPKSDLDASVQSSLELADTSVQASDIEDVVWVDDATIEEASAPALENNYSLNEKVIGTYIDGKPLYRKVLQIPTFSPTATNTRYTYNIDISALNPDNCMVTGGFITYGRSNYNLNAEFCFNSGGSSVGYSAVYPYIYGSTKIIGCELIIKDSAYLVNYNGYVIIEYTKTTD